MMMKLLVLVALVAFVSARPQQSGPPVEIIRSDSENDGNGNFKWNFETSDGTKQEQSGYVKNPEEQDPDKRIQVIQGSYTFLDAETGKPITVTYIADENGYQPTVVGARK